MVIYRPHKGGLAESMEEAKVFDDVQAMKEYIVKSYRDVEIELTGRDAAPFDVDDIVLGDDVMEDTRIGWKDVRHVCTKRFFSEDYIKLYGSPQCIGMCATEWDDTYSLMVCPSCKSRNVQKNYQFDRRAERELNGELKIIKHDPKINFTCLDCGLSWNYSDNVD